MTSYMACFFYPMMVVFFVVYAFYQVRLLIEAWKKFHSKSEEQEEAQ